jgi:MoaA/NifB/PqqE/SkfB family radical SAM enzyme
MMENLESLKDRGTYYAATKIINLLSKVSEDRFIQMTHWGEKLTRDPEVKEAIQKVRYYLERDDHPARELFSRVLSRLSEENRRRIFHSLFLHGWFIGGRKRDYWEKELGFRPPFILILSPTWKCNLRCRGCYTLGYGMKSELSLELADRILNECEQLGIYFITVLGGEPMVYPHLFTLVEKHPDIFFQIYTNGTLVTRERAQRLADLGNVAVVLSIEGGEKETDNWRGEGVYKRIMGAFEHLNRAATVTRNNIEAVSSEAFVDKMIGLGSTAQMYFLYIPVNGKADFSLMVTPEQRDLLRRRVQWIRNNKPMFVLDFWNDGPHVEGCIAGGRKYFHINARGDVEPCVYTHIAVDNIHDTPLHKALDSKLFRYIRSRQPHNSNHLRPCMIIDNPQVMREVIRTVCPHFTHPGAEEIYTDQSKKIDQYAEEYGILADEIWEKEYVHLSETGKAAAGKAA